MTTTEPDIPDLDDVLAGSEPDYGAEPEHVTTDLRADQLLRRLARLESDEARDQATALVQATQIRQWLEARQGRYARERAWLETSLAGYLRGIYERTGTMSLHLPAGDLTSSKAAPDWEVTDEAALLAWAREHAPGLVRQPDPPAPTIDRNAMKRELTRRDGKGNPLEYGVSSDGERPPGLEVHVPPADGSGRTYRAKPHLEGSTDD